MFGTTEGSNEVNSISLLQTSALTFLVFRLSKSVISRLIKNNVFLFTCQTSADFFYLSANRPDDNINFFLFIFNQSSFSIGIDDSQRRFLFGDPRPREAALNLAASWGIYFKKFVKIRFHLEVKNPRLSTFLAILLRKPKASVSSLY